MYEDLAVTKQKSYILQAVMAANIVMRKYKNYARKKQ